MKIIADLHIHSKYSRATSKNMTLENIDKYGKLKGLNLIGTGDFTHPIWFKELKQQLRERESSGLYKYKSDDVSYMITGEISLMYTQDGKGRRVHFVILVPSLDIAAQITDWLKTKGRVDYDGRPIFGFDAIEFTEAMVNISKDIMLIPAHIMTPWFGILGDKGGFDSIQDCFKDQVKHIHAVETGLSADPEMLWRISSLDKFTSVSFSDCHSFYPWRMGREATILNTKLTYKDVISAIKNKKIDYTIEVDPAYGKYHWDGHRACNVFLNPKQSIKAHSICPVCQKKLTVGVEHRIEELADRDPGFKLKNAPGFKRLLPLSELIAAAYNTAVSSKRVQEQSNKIMDEFKTELYVLLEAPEEKIKLIAGEKIAKLIIGNRNGKLKVQPGYDGIYGQLLLEGNIKSMTAKAQKNLRSFS